ncbi:2Fe-2S iron-sulfur cluster-binding protein [Plastorhodobacter daqingensis]|uniref:2Fe-2S iron-sulfur cluster-binding protein n=1 Tax=Plastorhodobacter daqingensis TaxID=1387281 RepID=A0ABW2UKF7_9RHOB
MPMITYVDPKGIHHTVDAPAGASVMEVALNNNISGIVAECNGSAACATCHVWIDERMLDLIPAPEPHEAEMLEFTAAESRPNSRLGCQVRIEESLAGMVVTIPETQV